MKKTSGLKLFFDTSFYLVVLFSSLAAIVFLFGIIFTLFKEGFGIFSHYGIIKFITGFDWYPTYDPPSFGILPLIVGSFEVTFIALMIGIPLGLGSAIYVSEVAKPTEKEILKPFIELLAGIPSVVYGLFGMAFLSPFIRQLFHLSTGLNGLTAGIILGIMIIPIISSISEDSLNAVPRALREASYALGANRWETIMRVVVPSARSGIFASVILGFGRAIGETMVVLMAAGGAARIPSSIFQPVRPMTSTIAAEMGETPFRTLHFEALFGIGIILFVITFASNITTELIRRRIRKGLTDAL
jgi:phosphate transport system permease protein